MESDCRHTWRSRKRTGHHWTDISLRIDCKRFVQQCGPSIGDTDRLRADGHIVGECRGTGTGRECLLYAVMV